MVENVLARQFEVTGPTPAWVSDITYIETREGWLYLAVVLSVQTRQVLGTAWWPNGCRTTGSSRPS